jgi:hypothetical protein
VIPEYSDIVIPFVFIFMIFAVWRRKWSRKKENEI